LKEIPRFLLFAALATLLVVTIVLGAVVITLWFGTRVTLKVPDDIRTDITSWDWGELTMVGDFASSTQDVLFTSYGAVPLTLSAMADQTSMNPSWFTPHYYVLDWTGHAYEIQPRESILTTFTLTVDVPMARDYMIDNQIPEVDVTFNIEVSVSNISLPHHFLTIVTTSGGTTDPAPGIHEYVESMTPVPVTAIPDLGYEWESWELDGVNYTNNNPINVIMNTNHTLTAYFTVAGPKVYVDPEFINVAPSGTFTISVKVGNIENLFGFDILFAWDTAILEYVSHTVTVPVETYPGGILYSPTLLVLDTVNSGTYNLAITSMTPAAPFNGTGTAFEITFNVLGIGTSTMDIVAGDFADPTGGVITVEIQDGTFNNTS